MQSQAIFSTLVLMYLSGGVPPVGSVQLGGSSAPGMFTPPMPGYLGSASRPRLCPYPPAAPSTPGLMSAVGETTASQRPQGEDRRTRSPSASPSLAASPSFIHSGFVGLSFMSW